MAICVNCGKEFEPMHGRMRFCNKTCRHATQWRQRQAEAQKSANIKPKKYQRKERKILVTDAEQKRIDQDIFEKTAVTFEQPKIYRPGDPEFDKIAATVTHIKDIPKNHSHYHKRP